MANLKPLSTVGDIDFLIADSSDKADVLDIWLNEMVGFETVFSTLKTVPSDYMREKVSLFIDKSLSQPATIIARDRANGNKLVGLRMQRVCEPSEPDQIYAPIDLEQIPDLKWRKFTELCKAAYNDLKWTERYPERKKMLLFQSIVIHHDYYGRGIAKRLHEHCFEVARRLGCDIVSAPTTGWKSQRLFESFGAQVIRKVRYADFLDLDGKPLKMDNGSEYYYHNVILL